MFRYTCRAGTRITCLHQLHEGGDDFRAVGLTALTTTIGLRLIGQRQAFDWCTLFYHYLLRIAYCGFGICYVKTLAFCAAFDPAAPQFGE
jgi:hypothetical protein